MAAKGIYLRKKLIKEGIISLVMLIAVAIGGFLLSNYDDSTLAEKQAKQGENDSMKAEHDSLQQQLGTGLEVSTFYEDYIKNHTDNFILHREDATQLMAALREKNHLSNLAITISPITDLTIDSVALKSGSLVKGDIHVSLDVVTDNSVYDFIESLERRLPGIFVMNDLKINRNETPLSNAMLVDLSNHKLTPLVNVDFTFNWLGIRPAEDKASPMNGTQNGAR